MIKHNLLKPKFTFKYCITVLWDNGTFSEIFELKIISHVVPRHILDAISRSRRYYLPRRSWRKNMIKRKVYCEKCRWLGFMAMGGTGMLGTEHYDICSHTNSIDKYPPDSPQSTKNKNNDCKDYGEKNDVSK